MKVLVCSKKIQSTAHMQGLIIISCNTIIIDNSVCDCWMDTLSAFVYEE